MMIYWIFFLHLVGDFGLQDKWMAENKSKSYFVLFCHVFVYTVVMFLGLSVVCLYKPEDLDVILLFIGCNCSVHFIQDAITSRYTAYYSEKKLYKNYYVTIGIDQFLHNCLILFTAKHILGVTN